MKKLNLNRFMVGGALCLAIAGSVTAAGAGAAFAATAAPTDRAPASAVPAAGNDPTICAGDYVKGELSIDASMYNGTDQTLTLDPALTGHEGTDEHWGTQPPATLAPGQCAQMDAYTDDIAGGLEIRAVYRMANGDFVPFSADKSAGGADNAEVFTSAPTYDGSTYEWTGQQDPRYNIWGNTETTSVHDHPHLKLEGGETNSYPLTSSDFEVDGGATTPTWQAACALGYHVRTDASTGKPIATIQPRTVSVNNPTLQFKTLSAADPDGTVDGTTQYFGFSYSVQNLSPGSVDATISWTCDPSVWGTNGTAPTFLQASPPATMPSGKPVDYRFTTLGFPAATYGVKSGQLPPGLSIDINGDLAGTPTTPGTYQFTAGASNAAGSVTTDPITITVS
jgi:hypothetical protein